MWRDIGLQDWILELNVSDAACIAACTDKILQDYPAALQQAEAASKRAIEFERKSMAYIAELLKPQW